MTAAEELRAALALALEACEEVRECCGCGRGWEQEHAARELLEKNTP